MALIDETDRGYLVADQIVANITEKVGAFKPGERIDWPYGPFNSSNHLEE